MDKQLRIKFQKLQEAGEFKTFTRAITDQGVPLIDSKERANYEQLLGKGASFDVYEGFLNSNGVLKRVAFKQYRHDILGLPPDRQKTAFINMKHEITLSYRLQNEPNIVQFHGIIFDKTDPLKVNPVIVVEAGDCNLEFYLTDDNVLTSWGKKLSLCLDVAMGVRALHSEGIVHGDLKAENVIVFNNPNGPLKAKISDLGFSYAISSNGPHAGNGTRPFRAPEATELVNNPKYSWLKGWEKKQNQDIYGVGLILWQIAKDGKQPYKSESRFGDGGKMNDMLEGCPSLLKLLQSTPDAPEEDLREIIAGALKLYPQARITLDEIITKLNAMLDLWRVSCTDQDGFVYVELDSTFDRDLDRTRDQFEKFVMTNLCDSILPAELSNSTLKEEVYQLYVRSTKAKRSKSKIKFFFAACYNWGFGVDRNHRKALWEFLEANRATPEATRFAGEYFLHGFAVDADYKKAVENFESASDAGSKVATYLLGVCYDEGKGVVKDPTKARVLWKKAAEGNVKEAIKKLADR